MTRYQPDTARQLASADMPWATYIIAGLDALLIVMPLSLMLYEAAVKRPPVSSLYRKMPPT